MTTCTTCHYYRPRTAVQYECERSGVWRQQSIAQHYQCEQFKEKQQ